MSNQAQRSHNPTNVLRASDLRTENYDGLMRELRPRDTPRVVTPDQKSRGSGPEGLGLGRGLGGQGPAACLQDFGQHQPSQGLSLAIWVCP